MSDELQKISYGASRAVIITAATPAREPTYNDGATGKEIIFNYNGVEYHIPTEERLTTGDAAPDASETITSGSDIIGVLGTGFVTLPATESLTAVLLAIDTEITSLYSLVVTGDFVTISTDQTILGLKTFENDVLISDNKLLIFVDDDVDITNNIHAIDNIMGVFNFDNNNVTNFAPTIGVADWSETGDFVIGVGSATYTHSSGSGELSFDAMAVSMPRYTWMKMTYTISGETGSASSYDVWLNGVSKQLQIEDGTFSLYFWSGSQDGGVNTFSLQVSSSLGGAFVISDILLESSGYQYLTTQGIQLGSVAISAINTSDEKGVAVNFEMTGVADSGFNTLRIGSNADNNQEFYMLMEEEISRVSFKTRNFLVWSRQDTTINMQPDTGDSPVEMVVTNIDSSGASLNSSLHLNYKLTEETSGNPYDALQIVVEKAAVWNDPTTLKSKVTFNARQEDGLGTSYLQKFLNYNEFGQTILGDDASLGYIRINDGVNGTGTVLIVAGDSGDGVTVRIAGVDFLLMDEGSGGILFQNMQRFAIDGTPLVLSASALGAVDVGEIAFTSKAFLTNPSVNNAAVMVTRHKRVLTASVGYTNGTSAQDWFSTLGDIALAASTTYEFEGELHVNTGVNTHYLSISFAGTATLTSIDYSAIGIKSGADTLTQELSGVWVTTAASTQVTLDTLNDGDTVKIKGTIRINAAGTVIPQFTFSATPGAGNVLRNSFISFNPIGVDTVASIGAWS